MKIIRTLIFILLAVLLIIGSQKGTALQATDYSSYIPLITANGNRWIGPYGGFITVTVIDPTNPLVLYAGTWGSGVYKSQDGGQNWHPMSKGLSNRYINSLAITPTSPEILYAGTYKDHIYKTSDGGNTWHWSGNGMQDEAIVYSIAVDPVSPGRIYAGTRGISNNGNPPWKGVLYRSSDAGQSWSPILEDVGGLEAQDWVYSIAINPVLPYTLYIATHEHGPFISRAYGNVGSWYSIHEGINDDSGRAILVDPYSSDDAILYYGVWHTDAVYKSSDEGHNWLPVNQNILNSQVYSMAIDAFHPETVFLGTFNRGILKTEDGAVTWSQSGLADDGIYSIAINPATPGTTYAGTAGAGMYMTTDGGTSWQSIVTGIQNSMVTKIIITSNNPAHLYASSYGAGVYESTNYGSTWSTMNYKLGDKHVHTMVIDPFHLKHLYALTDTGGLFLDDIETGSAWVKVGTGLPVRSNDDPVFPADHPFATHESLDVYPTFDLKQEENQVIDESLLTLAFAPSTANIAYLGTGGQGVYKTNDGGLSWEAAGLAGETVQSLVVDSTNPLIVYAATTSPGSMKKTSNGGNSWSNIALPVTFYTLAAAPTPSKAVYAGTANGLYRYQSGTWTHIGLSGLTVTSMAIDPTQPNKIYAGTTSGTYFSMNTGNTWKFVNENMEGITIQSIDFNSTNGPWIYYSTGTHGIFQGMIGN